MFKKIFVSTMIFTILCWSFGIAAINVAFAATLSAGDLIKASGAAVYYYGDDGKRYVFPTESTYMSWYADFSAVKTITDAELAAISIGGNATVRPGTKLVKINTDPKTYAVSTGGVLQHVDSEARAIILYGADWNQRIVDIPESFWINYTAGNAISSDEHPDGALVKYADAPAVYLIEGGLKRAITGDAFTANRFKDADITTIAAGLTYSDGAGVTEKEDSANVDGGVATNGGVATGGLSIALANDTPATAGVLIDSDGVLYTKAAFTANDGDVTVTGMKLNRIGFGTYSDFEKVWLVVDGVRRGSAKTINSADQASLLFSADTQKVVISDGTTKTFEIWASIDGTTGSATNALSISEVTTTSNVSGLPVTGNAMANSTAVAPDYTLESATIGNTANVGDTNVVVSKFKIDNDEGNETAVFEAIAFKSITKLSTTRAYTTDFTNFRLYDNSDNLVAGPIEMDGDNYLRFTLDTPFVVEAGTSKYEYFYVKADVADGAGRTLNLSVEGTYDVVVYGGTNMVRSDAVDSYTDASEYITVEASDLSIAINTAINPIAADVVENTTIVLLEGNITAGKGAVNAEALSVELSGTDLDFSATSEFDNLRVYIDDILVSEAAAATIYISAGSTDHMGASGSEITQAFTDTFTINGVVPVRVEIDVKDLKASDSGTIIKATINGSSITGTTDADGTTVAGTGTAAANNQTVATPGYKVYESATPVALTKVVGSQDVEFLGIDIKANNTIPVVVDRIKIELNGIGVAAGQSDVQNIELVDVGGNVVAGPANLNSSFEYEFTGLGLSVDSNGSKYIVRGDIASSLNNASTTGLWFAVISSEGTANNTTYNGTNSAGTTIADTSAEINSSTGKVITIGDGTMTLTAANDMQVSSQLVAATTNNAIGMWKMVAANEDIQIKKFRVGITTGSGGEANISRIGLYEGSTKIAETYSFAGGYTEFDITNQNFVVEAGSAEARYLTMKVDLTSTSDSVLTSGATIAAVLIDVEAWGTTEEVAPVSTTADGFAFTAAAGSATGARSTLTTTSVTMSTTTHGILAGDLLRLGTEQMYVSAAGATTTLTVVRAFNGTTAATSSAVTAYVARSIEGNDHKAYGSKVSIGTGGTTPSGTLAAWTIDKDVFKFKITPDAGATEDSVLNSVKVSLGSAAGIGVTVGTDWAITDMALYNGAGTLISSITSLTQATTSLNVATDYVLFDATTVSTKNGTYSASNRLAEPISASGEEFTVKVKTAGNVDTGDVMVLAISTFGAIATTGDIDWDDSVSDNVTWVDMGTQDTYVGGSWTK